MVLEKWGRLPYIISFIGYCSQDLFNIACRILVQLPSSFFSIRPMVHNDNFFNGLVSTFKNSTLSKKNIYFIDVDMIKHNFFVLSC